MSDQLIADRDQGRLRCPAWRWAARPACTVALARGFVATPDGLGTLGMLATVLTVFLAPVVAGLAGYASFSALWLHGQRPERQVPAPASGHPARGGGVLRRARCCLGIGRARLARRLIDQRGARGASISTMTLPTVRPAPTELRRTDEAVSRYGDAGSAWLAAMWQADPLADAVVNDPAGRGAARTVRTLMTEGIAAVTDPEPSVAALLDQLTDGARLAGPRPAGPRQRRTRPLQRPVGPGARRRLAARRRRQLDRGQAAAAHRPLRDRARGPVDRGRRVAVPRGRARRDGDRRARLPAHGAGADDPRARPPAHPRPRGVGRGRLGRADPPALHGVHARRVRPHLARRDGRPRRPAARLGARRHLPPVALRRARDRRRPGR